MLLTSLISWFPILNPFKAYLTTLTYLHADDAG